MARNGTVTLNNAVVVDVVNRKTGTSRIVAAKNGWTITVECSGPFPDGLVPLPDDTIDVVFGFDQKVKA